MTMLAAALFAFVATHFLLSHPLRAPLVARMGEGGFLGLYSLVAFVTLGWAAWAFGEAPLGRFLWTPGEIEAIAATAIMFLASVLLAGSFIRNPALPDPTRTEFVAPTPRGVFTITRHPMMWSFALWSVAHVLVSPRPAVILLSAAVGVLALGGAAGQDAKKAKLLGQGWRDWMARTAFVPFAKGASWPGRTALVLGTLIWLIATYAHPWAGAPVAGLWRWL